MGRSSKFSFPLTGKRSNPSFGTDSSNHRDEPQLSKAERLLGTSGLAVSSSNISRFSKLRSRPSYMSLQPAATSADEYSDQHNMHSLNRDEEFEIRPRSSGVRKQASSDALGSALNGDSGAGTSVTSSSRTWAIKNYKSNSTLKSFYDAEKYPLPISQQTSESAIRDMALRKGKPIVIRNRPGTREGTAAQQELGEIPPTDKKSKAGKTKRPPRLDLSRLFPRQSTNSLKAASPGEVKESPTAMSHTSEYFARQSPHVRSARTTSMQSPKSSSMSDTIKSPVRSNSSGGMKSPLMRAPSKLLKGHPSTSGSLKPAYANGFVSNDRQHVKNNVWRPPQSGGAKHWFDGLLEEEDEVDLEMETEASTPTTGILTYRDQDYDPPVEDYAPVEVYASVKEDYVAIEEPYEPLEEEYTPVEDDYQPPEPASSFTIQRGYSQRESDYINSRASTLKSPRTPVSPMSLAPPMSPRSPVSPRSNRTRTSVFANSDLGDTSVLSMSSSSEAESEDDDSINSRLPKFRNSIKVSEIDNILIGQAQAFRVSSRSKPKEEMLTGRRASVASASSIPSTSTTADTSSLHSSVTGPTYLAVPPRRARQRRSGHTRQPSSIPEDQDVSAQNVSSTSPPSSAGSVKADEPELPKSEPRKLMAVTEEEEALLEMMRSKRAAMAKHSLNNKRSTAKQSISSTTTTSSSNKSTRIHRPLSSSSSILDSFPISRSQRSSLMLANLNSHSQPDLPLTANERHRSGSTHSRATFQSKRTSNASSISSRLERSYPSYAPHLSLTPLDVSLSPIPSPTYSQPLDIDARSPSPEPFSSPSTPQTRRGSADVVICAPGSQRDSLASFGHLAHAIGGKDTLSMPEEDNEVDRGFNKDTRRHSRRRTASSDANMCVDSDSEKLEEHGKGDSVDPALTKKANRLSLTGPVMQQRSSLVTASTPDVSHAPEHLGYVWERNGDNVGLGFVKSESVLAAARCSVSEDVLAAWGSLGGWRDVSI